MAIPSDKEGEQKGGVQWSTDMGRTKSPGVGRGPCQSVQICSLIELGNRSKEMRETNHGGEGKEDFRV